MAKLRIAPLKGHEAFPKVFKKSKKFTGRDAVLFVEFSLLESESDILKTVSLGVGIRKKTARKAVMRNRVKRLLRTAMRNFLKNMAAGGNVPFTAIIAIWQSAPEHPLQLRLEYVEQALWPLLEQARQYAITYFSQDRTR
ncbi:MAG TPA: ribonuclease P protein component [Patescibacteria group bacterium]|nr:ribonuclease P protein component [Patescibacteria group bacterium]